MAPIQTPQRLNRLVEHIAKWPELSGTESKGSRGRLGASGPFLFFHFVKPQNQTTGRPARERPRNCELAF
jgi:hypothetical protein